MEGVGGYIRICGWGAVRGHRFLHHQVYFSVPFMERRSP
jgi:hypothetical protein